MTFSTNSVEYMRLTSTGKLGIGTDASTSALQVAGSAATTYTAGGIHAGMDPAAVNNPLISLVGGTTSALGQICWRKPGSLSSGTFNAATNFGFEQI